MDDAVIPPRDPAILDGMCPRRLPPAPSGPVSLGVARGLGWGEHDCRDERLVRVTKSVRSLHPPTDVREQARAFALALPDDCAFSHVTAARLWRLPLPVALERRVRLDVMRATGRGRVERAGCLGHRGLERRTVVARDGLRLTSPAYTWVDLGDVPSSPLTRDDLVVAGDAIVTLGAPPGGGSPVAVEEAVAPLRLALERRGSPRGKRLLVEALGRVRPRVRSPMETRSRLVFVDAGFPEPQPCAPLQARDGGWLAEGDLVWREQRVVGKYQGSVHAGIQARSADAYRNGLLGDEGWTVLEIFNEDLTEQHRRFAMLRRFARALSLDPHTLTIR